MKIVKSKKYKLNVPGKSSSLTSDDQERRCRLCTMSSDAFSAARADRTRHTLSTSDAPYRSRLTRCTRL